MIDPVIREQILSDLDRLSSGQQLEALRLVRSLADPLPRGARLEELLPLAGTLDDASAREMRVAIEEERPE